MSSSAAAQRSRKRRGDDAQEGVPATRRRCRLLGSRNFAAALDTKSPRKRRRRVCVNLLSVVRCIGLRIAVAAAGARRRCCKRPIIAPLRRRAHSGLLPTDRGRVQVLRVESEHEADKGLVVRSDSSVPASLHHSELYMIMFKPLTDEEETEVDAVLRGRRDGDKIIVMHKPSNIVVTKKKLQCLRPHGWLNDEVTNLYIELVRERAEREPERFMKCHFFNTFFYKKLCGKDGYDYQAVKRWTTFKKLGYGLTDCEKIFVPVHRDVHWSLAVINMKYKTLQYLDSLGDTGLDVLRVLARYIVDELKDKCNTQIDINSWTIVVSDSVPLQKNGWDCGMFMLKYIDFHSRGLEPIFSQEHMVYFRKRTANEIMRLRVD